MLVLELFGDGDRGPGEALCGIVLYVEIADHVLNREKPPLDRDQLEKFSGDASDFGFVENGPKRLHLLLRREYRALDETPQILARAKETGEGREIGGHVIGRPGFLRQGEQRLGVASGHSGNE